MHSRRAARPPLLSCLLDLAGSSRALSTRGAPPGRRSSPTFLTKQVHPRASRARGAPRRALRQPPLPHLLIRQASCSRHERCASRPPLPSYLPVSRCSKRSSHGTVLTGQACLEPDERETCLPAASPLLPSQLAGAARVPRAEGAPSCSLHARRPPPAASPLLPSQSGRRTFVLYTREAGLSAASPPPPS